MTYPEITNPAYERPHNLEITISRIAVDELQSAKVHLATVRSRRKQLDDELRRERDAEERAIERYRKACEALAEFVSGGKEVAP